MDTIKRFVDISNHVETVSLEIYRDLSDFDIDSETYKVLNKTLDNLDLVLDKITGHVCAEKIQKVGE